MDRPVEVQPVTIVDVQISPAHCSWAEYRDHCLAAEQLGFGTVWVYDHLGGVALDGDSMIECFTLLGALAQATTTIELGTMVVNVWNRQVGTLVSAAGSVGVVSGRQFHLGLGAGTSPTSPWSAEQHAVGAVVEPSMEARQARVEQVLDLTDRVWFERSALAPDDPLRTLPLPSPIPTRILGVNSVRLSRVAGSRAEGINVPWNHPRRDEFLAAADDAAGERPFVRTVWTHFDEALLDPDHPVRDQMRAARIDRVVLAELGRPHLTQLA